jgi:hypothetical protein
VFTDGSATFGIADTATDLEAKYETLSGQSPYFIEITDDGGKKARGYIRGIAKSGDNYTLSIFDDAAGSNQNWDKDAGFNESASSYTYDIKTRDGIAESVAGLASTSDTSPTLPSGYTHKRRVGCFYTDGTPEVVPFEQNEESWVYLEQQSALSASAAASKTSLSLAGLVPSVATEVALAAEVWSNGASVLTTFNIYVYNETNTKAEIYLNLGSGAEGGANSMTFAVPVRLSGGNATIDYEIVVSSGSPANEYNLDVQGFRFPILAEV